MWFWIWNVLKFPLSSNYYDTRETKQQRCDCFVKIRREEGGIDNFRADDSSITGYNWMSRDFDATKHRHLSLASDPAANKPPLPAGPRQPGWMQKTPFPSINQRLRLSCSLTLKTVKLWYACHKGLKWTHIAVLARILRPALVSSLRSSWLTPLSLTAWWEKVISL